MLAIAPAGSGKSGVKLSRVWSVFVLRVGGWYFLAQVLLLSLSLCVLPSEPASSGPADSMKVYRLGVRTDNYPFSFRDSDGRVKGFAYELLKEIEHVMNLRFERVEGTTKEINRAFYEGELDVVQTLAQIPEREAWAEFSVPYFVMEGKVFCRRDLPRLRSISDLKGKRVLVFPGSSDERALRRLGLSNEIAYAESVQDALFKLNSGEGDVAVASGLLGLSIIHKYRLANVRDEELMIPEHQVRYCIAVRKGDYALLARVNEGLAILHRTGRYEELYRAWFGPVLPRGYTREQVLTGIAIGLGLALVVAIWSTEKLRRYAERIRQQSELVRRSEAKYRTLFDTANDAIFLMDEARFLDCNARALEMFGCNRERIIGATPVDFSPPVQPDGTPSVTKAMEKIRHAIDKGPQFFEWLHCRADGTPFMTEVSLNALKLGDRVLLQAIVRDISERKRAEDALRESETKFRLLSESSLVGIYMFQHDRFLYVNPALAAMFGYTVDEIVGKLGPRDLTHPDDWELVQQNIHRRIINGVPHIRTEFRGLRKDGSVIYVESHGSRLEFHGEPAIMGTLIDITDRKQAEDALRESERKYRELVESANSIILRWTPDGRVTFLNRYGQEFFGYTADEIIGRHVIGTITPAVESTGRPLLPLMEQICQNPKAFEQNINENMRRNGERVWIAWTNKAVLDEQGRVREVLSIGHDITERLRAEEALRALTARLQSVREEEGRRIARELHDELGQVLTGLKMDLHMLERLIQESDTAHLQSAREKVVDASHLVDIAIRTVQRICAELRPALLDRLGLVDALRFDAQQFQHRTGIKCHLQVQDNWPTLPTDMATAIYRICQESLTNVARHARATEVTVSLRIGQGADTARADTTHLIVEVQDNGIGIPPEKLSDPHSLGLTSMMERARVMGGTLSITSRAEGGTVVRLQVPWPAQKSSAGI